MPSTVMQISEAFGSAVATVESPTGFVELAAGAFAAGASDSLHPAKATLSAMKIGADR
jgi:hypothetical protein